MFESAQETWDFSPIASPSKEAFSRELELALQGALEFGTRYRGKVATLDPAALLQAIISYEKLQETALKPQYYAHLLFAADSANDGHKTLAQKAEEAGNRLSRELLFFDLEIMALPEEQFQLLLLDESLANYGHYLTSTRKFAPHSLPEREEQLLKQKDLTGCTAFSRLFDELSASFLFSMTINGEEKELTGEELLGMLHHPDRDLRERAFSLFLERHGEHSLVYGAVFNNIALDHAQDSELRGYRHPREPTDIGNELASEVVRQLMTVTEANYPLAQEYFRLKARLLGLDKLKNSDIYAPVQESPRQYGYGEARELVLTAYEAFNPAYRSILAAFFSERRIDAFPRPGKSGGAFCMGMTPALSPYLLLNHTGNLRDVCTMAHELGHGLHYVLSAGQSLLNYHAPLPLAETASVFGEMLLTRHLLAEEQDPSVKIALLCAKIEDILATTCRQVVLTRFEERFHLERKEDLLTHDRLCQIWLEENGKLFGETVEMIPAYRLGWSYISHFVHARFYCYSYTFAELLVLALYKKYQEEGALFLPKYEAILASGGSLSPTDTAALAGIDLNRGDFWQNGYDILAQLIAELKELLH